MNKLVRESILEGVADKAAERSFGVSQPHEDFERKYKETSNSENVVVKIPASEKNHHGPVLIIKNPKDLSKIESYGRGAIDSKGNFYIEDHSEVMHDDVIKALMAAGIFKPIDRWWKANVNDMGFVPIQLGDKKDVYIGESYEPLFSYNKQHHPKEWEATAKIVKQYYDACKKLNPGYTFLMEYLL